ncbi:hypothetical protein NL676_011003 [Syzygium grande]|nr:hypothetical protein NL676_011003 [Syzygium grande]
MLAPHEQLRIGRGREEDRRRRRRRRRGRSFEGRRQWRPPGRPSVFPLSCRRSLIRLVQVGTWFRPPSIPTPASDSLPVAGASTARGRIGSRLASTESEAEAKLQSALAQRVRFRIGVRCSAT